MTMSPVESVCVPVETVCVAEAICLGGGEETRLPAETAERMGFLSPCCCCCCCCCCTSCGCGCILSGEECGVSLCGGVSEEDGIEDNEAAALASESWLPGRLARSASSFSILSRPWRSELLLLAARSPPLLSEETDSRLGGLASSPLGGLRKRRITSFSNRRIIVSDFDSRIGETFQLFGHLGRSFDLFDVFVREIDKPRKDMTSFPAAAETFKSRRFFAP